MQLQPPSPLHCLKNTALFSWGTKRPGRSPSAFCSIHSHVPLRSFLKATSEMLWSLYIWHFNNLPTQHTNTLYSSSLSYLFLFNPYQQLIRVILHLPPPQSATSTLSKYFLISGNMYSTDCYRFTISYKPCNIYIYNIWIKKNVPVDTD